MEENTKNTKNTKKIVLGVVLFAVVIAVLFGCWKVFEQRPHRVQRVIH